MTQHAPTCSLQHAPIYSITLRIL